MTLPGPMRDALKAALKNDGLRRIHTPGPGQPPWPAHPLTLRALETRELLSRAETRSRKGWPVTVWRITDAGRDALDPPARVRVEVPRRLRVGRGPTLLPMSGGGWEERTIPEPEPVSHATLKALPSSMEARQRHLALRLERQQDREELVRAGLALLFGGLELESADRTAYERSVLKRVKSAENRAKRAA